MSSRTDLPIEAGPENYPWKKHHTFKYYAHRVRDRLSTRISKLICAIFLGLLFLVGLISFILWLSLRPHRPRFHIHDFSIPAIAQPNGFENAQINFNITARNSNQNIGIFYDAITVTVYYQDQSVGGAQLFDAFYQEPKSTRVLGGALSGATLTVTNQRWLKFLNDRSRGIVEFRVESTSAIKFKVSSWTSKRHKLHANCQVGVGPDGLILNTYKDKKCPVYFS